MTTAQFWKHMGMEPEAELTVNGGDYSLFRKGATMRIGPEPLGGIFVVASVSGATVRLRQQTWVDRVLGIMRKLW